MLVLPLLLPTVETGEVVEGPVDVVKVWPLDVRTVTELLLASAVVASEEVCPDVGVAELDAAEELSPALGVVEAELCAGAADPDVSEELGKWPTKN